MSCVSDLFVLPAFFDLNEKVVFYDVSGCVDPSSTFADPGLTLADPGMSLADLKLTLADPDLTPA